MARADKTKVIKRSDKVSPITQNEMDENLQQIRNVIDDVTELETNQSDFLRKDDSLSEIADPSVGRAALDVYGKAESDNRYLQKASNLSDLDDKAASRNNLDVYSKAESDSLYGTMATRDLYISEVEPQDTDGDDGDVWFVYTTSTSGDNYIVKFITIVPGDVYIDSTADIDWYQGYIPELPDTSNISQPADVMTFNELSQFLDAALDNIIDNMPNGQLLGYITPNITEIFEYRCEPLFNVSPDGVSLGGTYTTLVDAMSAIESFNTNEPSYITVALRHMISINDSDYRSPAWSYISDGDTIFDVNLGLYFFSVELQTIIG